MGIETVAALATIASAGTGIASATGLFGGAGAGSAGAVGAVPPPPSLPAAANPPTLANAGVQAGGMASMTRAAGALMSTVMNQGGAQGLAPATTAQRSLLG